VLEKTILTNKEQSVLKIVLNRPEKLNAMTVTTKPEIIEALREAEKDNSIRSVVITGAGRAFCAGVDLNLLGELSPTNLIEDQQGIKEMILYIRNFPKPVIAAVNGIAVGIGFSLVLACDIIIASDKARFGGVWVQRGLHTDGGAAYLLPQRVGTGKATEMLLTGRVINASEAMQIGLTNQVVDSNQLDTAIRELTLSLEKGAPLAQTWIKSSLNQATSMDLATMLDYETRAQAMLAFTDDSREAVAAFLQKRQPVYKWR
jgi:2-(1,2-epoxy-1,2-dihydrophenyl)acetyl-CoA isomerase